MGLETATLRTAEIVLGQVTPDQKQRARLAVAAYARRKHPVPRADAKPATHTRAERSAQRVCALLLDMLGLLPEEPQP